MSDDVIGWKREILDIAARLEAKTKQSRWTERTGQLIERDFVVGAYAIHKLIDSGVASREIAKRNFPVRRFDRIGDDYDFENGRRATLSVVELCREITDNCVFEICCGETDDLFDGVYVSSTRDQDLYLILASDYIALCSDVVV